MRNTRKNKVITTLLIILLWVGILSLGVIVSSNQMFGMLLGLIGVPLSFMIHEYRLG